MPNLSLTHTMNTRERRCCICACSSPLFDIEFWLFESESNGPQSRFTEERISRSNLFGCPLPDLTIFSMACHISRLNMNNIKNVV